MNYVIEAHQVSKVIDGNDILKQVDFRVNAKSIHGLIGANGAGKTTLLRLINGAYQPTSGEVRVFGECLPHDAAPIRQRVHLVSSDGVYYPSFKVKDMFRYASMLYSNWDATRCSSLVKALELPLIQPIRKLSLGARMQLRLAVALSSHPEILLLDEPTNGLDPVVRRQFLQLIVQEVAGTGMTVVIATHRLEDLEAIADGISVLYQGRMILSGDIETLKTDFHELIAVMDTPIPEETRFMKGVMSVQSKGKIHSCIVQGNTLPFTQYLQQCGAFHIDVQPLAFEELFRALMQKEGYTRDAILLS